MTYPALLKYTHEDEFRDHYFRVYCKGPLQTFDGISVRFNKSDYKHLCFQDDDHDGVREAFAWNRAERLDWIKHALEDSNAILKFGWLTKKGQVLYDRRVALVQGNYAVTIQFTGESEARIITAFLFAQDDVAKFLQDPDWELAKRIWTGKK